MQVIRIDYVSDPCEVAWACAEGTIWTRPVGLAVQTCEALAVVVLLAGTVVGAVVLAQTSVAIAALVPNDLTPSLGSVGGSTGRSK